MLDKGDEIHYSILTYIFPTPNLNTNKEMKTNNQNFFKSNSCLYINTGTDAKTERPNDTMSHS